MDLHQTLNNWQLKLMLLKKLKNQNSQLLRKMSNLLTLSKRLTLRQKKLKMTRSEKSLKCPLIQRRNY